MGDLENDMDELFRRAANHYPLKTDGADWDKLMAKLPDVVGTPLPLTEPKSRTTNKKLLWLILLFPMGWLCNYYFSSKNNRIANNMKVELNTLKRKQDKTYKANNNQYNKNNDHLKSTAVLKENNATFNKNIPQTVYQFNKETIVDYSKQKEDEIFNHLQNSKSGELKGLKIEQKKFDEEDKIVQNAIQTNSNKQPYKKDEIPQDNTINKTEKLNKANFGQKDNDTTTKAIATTAKKYNKNNKGFYISAIGGMDASSVKSQGIKKIGYGFGLLVGYQLNKHIAFETGFLWDKKNYFTDGAYFNKSRTGIPSTITVSDLYGNCNMFEVPLDFRFDFVHSKRGLFFGTAGLSSYFMKKEAYDYEATAWGSQWPEMKTYNNSGSNLFSIVDLSIGLEHKIGKQISVRINPYLKIPLKGIGIGSIPITSSGINIGITYPFHK